MKTSSNKQLRRKLLCALVAGALAAPFAAQTAYALPIEGANAATNAGEANISTSGTVMDITGKTEHNVLRWEDFSIDSGEKVRFDGGSQTRDYLNLVTGEGASNIYGKIEGGRNVYLVNPHGILFAKDSEVNTGALYLSTANPADIAAATNTFKANGTSPLSATAQMGDVLNLGTVKTSKLYIEGKNVTVLNTDDIQNTDGTALTGTNVKIRSAETPHIGYDVANRATANFDEGGGSMWRTFYNYKYPNTAKSASGRGWDVANLGGTAHTDYDYMRVHTVYDLQNINAKRDGRYILAGDIDATATTHWNSGAGFAPLGDVGNKFTGRLDGAGHTLRGLYINRQNTYSIGLFGYADGARIENLSLVDGNVEGDEAVGGIVGYADGTEIRNVSYAGSVVGNQKVGGIAGDVSGGSIQNAWNAGTVSVRSQFLAGGIVGRAMNNAVIQNVCNTGAITGSKLVGGIVGAIDDSTLQHAWNTGTVTGNQKVGGIVGQALGGSIRHAVWKSGSAGQAVGESNNGADVTTDVKVAPEAQMKLAATYTDWKDANGTALVATEGGKGTPWRIYNGHTMPLLTALMKGTKRLEKVYDGNVFATTDPHITLVHPGKDVGTYDAYSDQLGYDLIGGATIKPKSLTLGFTSGTRFNKIYDGNVNVTRTLTKGTNYSLTGFVGSEGADVELAGAVTGKYADKNAGRDKEVTFQTLALTGTGAGNYTITKAQGVGTIAPKELNLALANGARFDKTYDGNANVAQTLAKGTNYSLTGFVTGEGTGIELAAVTGKYADKNAAADKAVTFGGLTLTGAGAGNYVLNSTNLAGTGTITPRALTLGEVAAQTKTYDGTTAADVAQFRAALNNVVAGEENLVTAIAAGAAYNDKNVARANRIDYTGVALAGADAGNYSLAATTAQGTGTIAKRSLTIGAVAEQTKTYDGTTAAEASQFHAMLNNVVMGEENSVTATAAGAAYNDKNVAKASKVNYTDVKLTGTGAGNYTIATTAEGAGTITKRALTLGAVESQTRIYDGTTVAEASKFRAALNNVVAGDNVTAAAAGAAYNDKNVARANRIDYTGVALTGAEAANYSLAATTAQGAGAITRRTLTVGTVAAQTKIYDGTTAADAAAFRATLGNLVAGEESSVTATAAGAAYNSKDVAQANAVSYTGVALTGTGAGNYAVADTAQGAGTIAKRALTLGEVTAQTKTYDGTRAADASKFRATLGNTVAGDNVTAAAATATFNDKNVAAANRIDYTGVALAGADVSNYTLAATMAQGAGTITPRTLTFGTVAAQTKTYDGTTAADAAAFRATLGNLVAGEENSVTATATGAAYNDKNVAGANTVSYTGVALTGTGAGNYAVADTAQGAGTITKRALTLDEVTAQTKTYDGTTAADASKFRATLGNTVAGDNVTAAAATATFNDKNVAAANRIDYTGVALAGADAGNYTLAATMAQGAGTITPRTLTFGTVAAQTKIYDGNTSADAAKFRATLAGFVAGEEGSATATAAGAAYNDKNVARANAVSYTDVALTGAGAGNYAVATTAEGRGAITPRALTLGEVTAQTKTYDGTTAADASKFHAALNNVVAGDNVTAAAAGAAYNDKNVARAKRIDYTGVALRGADAGNYSVAATTAQGAGTITPRDLTLTADAKKIVQGEPLPSFTGRAEGFADGEDASVFGADGLTFESTVKNTETPGSYGVTGRIGSVTDGVLGNYRIVQAADNATAFTIHAAALPGGLLASLVQDAAPRFDFGFGDTVYLYGTARPIRAATLGFYRFDAEEGLEIQGLRL